MILQYFQMSSDTKVALCSIHQSLFEEISNSNCSVKIDGNVASFIDQDTGKCVMSLSFGHKEERTELALIRNGSVAYSLPICQDMTIDLKSVERHVSRVKDRPKKRNREIETVEAFVSDRFEIEPGPIAFIDDFDDDRLIRVKIEETLEFVKTLDNERDKVTTLSEVIAFVLKETRDRVDLNDSRNRLQSVRLKRDVELLSQELYRFALKL